VCWVDCRRCFFIPRHGSRSLPVPKTLAVSQRLPVQSTLLCSMVMSSKCPWNNYGSFIGTKIMSRLQSGPDCHEKAANYFAVGIRTPRQSSSGNCHILWALKLSCDFYFPRNRAASVGEPSLSTTNL